MSPRRFAAIFAATMALPAAGCTNLSQVEDLNARTPEEAQARTTVLAPVRTSDGQALPCAIYRAAEQDICLRRNGRVALSYDNAGQSATDQKVAAIRFGSHVVAAGAAVGLFALTK